VFEVGEAAINRISRRRFIEATTEPDNRVLNFSCDWTNAVDVRVVAVEERSEEFWWVMVLRSPPVSEDEHDELTEKLELKVVKQCDRLRSHEIEQLADSGLLSRLLVLSDTVAHPVSSCVAPSIKILMQLTTVECVNNIL